MSAPPIEATPPGRTVHSARSATTTDQWRRFLRRPRANPILRRELRVRMRGRRAFLVLGVYLMVLGLATYAIEQILVHAESNVQLQSFQVGQILFAGLALFEITLLIFVVPALTATAICAERERGTLDLLRATPVRPRTIVWGKLVAALSYAAVLIVASIPLASIVFLFGGVAPVDVWAAFALLGVTTIAFGMLGLFCSALARRTSVASVLAYVTAAGIVVGTLALYVFLDAIDGGLVDSQAFGMVAPDMGMRGAEAEVAMVNGEVASASDRNEPPRFLLAVNPVLAMASLVGDAVDEGPADPWLGRPGGIPVFGDWLEFLRVGDSAFAQPMFDERGQRIIPQPSDERPLWRLTIALYGGASVLLFLATVALVSRTAGHRWRPRLPKIRRHAADDAPAVSPT